MLKNGCWKILEDDVNSLLKMFGLSAKVMKASSNGILKTMFDEQRELFIGGICMFNGMNGLAWKLFMSNFVEWENGSKYDCEMKENPFRECRSIEEALVRKDLLCGKDLMAVVVAVEPDVHEMKRRNEKKK